ncbi:MAG: GNAT family N-acetyltransferase [Sphingomonas sp.]|uniref:GNAT family N-acetyltransferase n=1 Tax=Sphingomonas sp. TaxID=28214 RepID=UPI001ACB5722|nr:GNAT family protein [Sphingomonas sp.]MBN8806697.1 GNAT family N-acetyltransferase [Sphingomonas sp.]
MEREGPRVPTLTTERLVLRQLRADDADALHPMYADVDATMYGSHPATRTIAETREQVAKRAAAPDWRAWAITRTGDDTAIGTVASYEKRQGKVTEIGYFLSRAHWGQGIVTEAVAALLDRLFAEGQRRVFADTDPDNTASTRVLERLGFTPEARLRAEWETHIGVRDSLIWGLLEPEWTAARHRT